MILKTQHREHNSNYTASTTDFEWNNGRNKVSAWEGWQELESVKDMYQARTKCGSGKKQRSDRTH